MKKLIIFTLAFLTMFTYQNVNATDYEFEYNIINTSGDYYVVQAELEIPAGVETVEFTITNLGYNSMTYGGSQATIYFFDNNDNQVDSFLWSILYDNLVEEDYIIDFKLLDVWDDVAQGGGYFVLQIPQTFEASIPSQYYDALDESDNEISFSYDRGYQYDVVFVDSTFWTRLEYSDIYIPYNTLGITVEFGYMPYYVEYQEIYNSSIILYNGALAADTLNFDDYTNLDTNVISFAIPYDPIDYEVNDLDTFDMNIYIDNDLYTSQSLTHDRIIYYLKNLEISFNNDVFKTINFVSENVIYESVAVELNTLFNYPDDPTAPDGYDFTGWYTNAGVLYTSRLITVNQIESDNTFTLYARYEVTPVGFDPDLSDPVQRSEGIFGKFETMLAGFGFDTPTGYIIVYALTLIIILGFLAIKGAARITYGFIAFIIHVGFTFWGVLDSFIIIIGFMLFGLMIIIPLLNSGEGLQNE